MRIIRIGLDTSKHVFQIHRVDENEQTVLRRQIRSSEVEKLQGDASCGVTEEGFSGVALSVRTTGRILPVSEHFYVTTLQLPQSRFIVADLGGGERLGIFDE